MPNSPIAPLPRTPFKGKRKRGLVKEFFKDPSPPSSTPSQRHPYAHMYAYVSNNDTSNIGILSVKGTSDEPLHLSYTMPLSGVAYD